MSGEDDGSAAVSVPFMGGMALGQQSAAFLAVSQSAHYTEHVGEFRSESLCDLSFLLKYHCLQEVIQVVVNVVLMGLLGRQGFPTEPGGRNVEIGP